MADPFGSSTSLGPQPAGYIGDQPTDGYGANEDSPVANDGSNVDPFVLWSRKTADILHRIRQRDTDRMKKNNDYYDNNSWDVSGRPKWKFAKKINYGFWVPQQWAAIVTDNKPKFAYHVYDLKDQWQADLVTADFTDWYYRTDFQSKIHDAELLASIESAAFIKLVYDPFADKGDGDQVATVVSAQQVYFDSRATSLDDCSIMMHEYIDSIGAVLERFPHLKGKIDARDDDDETKSVYSPSENLVPSEKQTPINDSSLSPGSVGDIAGTTTHRGPYGAQTSPPGDAATNGVIVREFCLRPKGPDAEITLDIPAWNASNEPATRKKMIRMYENEHDRKGYLEPVQTVVLGNNVIYELPMSVVEPLKFASENLGGPQVIHIFDTEEVITRPKRVSLYPTGRYAVVCGDHKAVDGMNPFAHGEIHFTKFDAYKNPKKIYGMSDLDNIVDLLDYLYRLYSLLLDAAFQTANPIIRLPLSIERLADEEITNAPGAIWWESLESLKFGKREKGPDMPTYVMALLELTIREIRNLSGLTEVATGGKFKGQQSSETVSMYQESAGLRFRDRIKNVGSGISRLGRQYAYNVAQFANNVKMLKVMDAVGTPRNVSFIGSQITAGMKMIVKAGDMLPTSPSARLNYLFNLFGTPFADFTEVLRALEEAGIIDSAVVNEKKVRKMVAEFQANPQAGPIALWENPGLMQLLMGGGGPNKGGQKKGNAGRSAKGSGKPRL
jgi:hypothetical protein